ncbi:MAG: hypothetical protein PHH11_02815 [Methylomonas sp.]|nr:hypothetical protein [Methylomonas sp.]
MEGVLRWADAVSFFGDELVQHERFLSRATQTTYGLLVSRSVQQGQTLLENREGEHAEERLVLSPFWVSGVVNALESWDVRDAPMVVMLAINRAPCASCSHILAGELHALHRRFPLRVEKQYFILASLGYYQGRDFMTNQLSPNTLNTRSVGSQRSQSVTTDRGLNELSDAGWRLCVMDFGHGVTSRGSELLNFLRHR